MTAAVDLSSMSSPCTRENTSYYPKGNQLCSNQLEKMYIINNKTVSKMLRALRETGSLRSRETFNLGLKGKIIYSIEILCRIRRTVHHAFAFIIIATIFLKNDPLLYLYIYRWHVLNVTLSGALTVTHLIMRECPVLRTAEVIMTTLSTGPNVDKDKKVKGMLRRVLNVV